MLDRLDDDMLLIIFCFCSPEDISELSLVSKRFCSIICACRGHLPRFKTNCAIKLTTGEREIRIRLWPCRDDFVSGASSKQIV